MSDDCVHTVLVGRIAGIGVLACAVGIRKIIGVVRCVHVVVVDNRSQARGRVCGYPKVVEESSVGLAAAAVEADGTRVDRPCHRLLGKSCWVGEDVAVLGEEDAPGCALLAVIRVSYSRAAVSCSVPDDVYFAGVPGSKPGFDGPA